ncbi:MAG: hypothetical protein LAO07_03580 [Acidobacteriia bacterium]|nr:hypothetical protein [Terriglobia bacterium]
MRDFFSNKGIFLFILLSVFAVISFSESRSFTPMVGVRVRERVRDVRSNLDLAASFLRSVAPRLADLAANLAVGAGVLVALLFIQLLVSAPLGLYSLHRKVRSLDQQLVNMRLEMQEMNRLLQANLPPRLRNATPGDSWAGNYPSARPPSPQLSPEREE